MRQSEPFSGAREGARIAGTNGFFFLDRFFDVRGAIVKGQQSGRTPPFIGTMRVHAKQWTARFTTTIHYTILYNIK